jgi:hypothetical protein
MRIERDGSVALATGVFTDAAFFRGARGLRSAFGFGSAFGFDSAFGFAAAVGVLEERFFAGLGACFGIGLADVRGFLSSDGITNSWSAALAQDVPV